MAMMKYKKIPKEELEDLYIRRDYSMEQISKIYNCCSGTIESALKFNNIKKEKTYNWLKNDYVELNDI